MSEPRWVTEARERVAATKRIMVGSDIHLLEMAVNDYDATQKRLNELEEWKNQVHQEVGPGPDIEEYTNIPHMRKTLLGEYIDVGGLIKKIKWLQSTVLHYMGRSNHLASKLVRVKNSDKYAEQLKDVINKLDPDSKERFDIVQAFCVYRNEIELSVQEKS